MNFPLIDRLKLKSAIKETPTNYESIAEALGISKTALAFKISGRKTRGLTPFTEQEVQILRGLFGDSILNPAPKAEAPRAKGGASNGK